MNICTMEADRPMLRRRPDPDERCSAAFETTGWSALFAFRHCDAKGDCMKAAVDLRCLGCVSTIACEVHCMQILWHRSAPFCRFRKGANQERM